MIASKLQITDSKIKPQPPPHDKKPQTPEKPSSHCGKITNTLSKHQPSHIPPACDKQEQKMLHIQKHEILTKANLQQPVCQTAKNNRDKKKQNE